MRKLGCRRIGITSPRSLSTRLLVVLSSSPLSRCSTSPGARFSSSSSTHLPCSIAATSGPGTNEKAKLLSTCATFFSNAATSAANARSTASHLSYFSTGLPCAAVRARACCTFLLAKAPKLASCAASAANLPPSSACFSAGLKSACLLSRKRWLNSSQQRLNSGIASWRRSTGLKPPTRSLHCVCSFMFSTTSSCPTHSARYWITVVLPQPVSPTSSIGSWCVMHAAICCISRRLCFVWKNRRLFARFGASGIATRPTRSTPASTLNAGAFCTYPSTADTDRSHTTASTCATVRAPRPAGRHPANTSSASSRISLRVCSASALLAMPVISGFDASRSHHFSTSRQVTGFPLRTSSAFMPTSSSRVTLRPCGPASSSASIASIASVCRSLSSWRGGTHSTR